MQELEAPEKISSRYQVVAVLGEGGMGRVYKAHDETLQRTVAVKVLLGHYAANNIQRFQREAKTMSSLKHANLIDVYDFGITGDGEAYLVMEYVVGVLLSDVLKKRKRLTVDETIELAIEIADGMRHAHSRGIVHRDLKPSNIMVADEKKLKGIKIFDFGISKSLFEEKGDLTQPGAMLGTPLYMSPEQARAQNVDGRSDQYSLGCIIYACLRGRPPFQGDTAIDTINMHLNDAPVPLPTACRDVEIPPALSDLVLKLLSKNPQDRFNSMGAVMEALAGASAKPLDQHVAVVKLRKDRLNKNIATTVASVGLFGLIGVACASALSPPPPIPPKPRAKLQKYFIEDQDKVLTLDKYNHTSGSLAQDDKAIFVTDYALRHKDYDEGYGQLLPVEALDSLDRDNVYKISLHGTTRIGKGVMEEIAKFPNIRELWLSGDQYVGDQVTALNGMQKLESLTLNSETLNDATISKLKYLPSLKYLCLERTAVTDASLSSICANFPTLEILDFGWSMLEGKTLADVKKLGQLRRLEVNNMVHNFNIRQLKHPTLEVLDIAQDQGVEKSDVLLVLKQCPKLQQIRITLADNLVKPEVISSIKSEMQKQKRNVALVNEYREFATGQERYADEAKKKSFDEITNLLAP